MSRKVIYKYELKPDNIIEDFEFIDTVSLFSGNFVAHIFKDK